MFFADGCEVLKAGYAGADLGFIKGGGLTQGTNLLGRGMLELGGLGACPPQEIFEK